LFVIPWKHHWIIGTTDTDWTLDLAHPAASRSDIDYLLETLNRALAVPLQREDIEGVYAGLRPLLHGESDATSQLSRTHAVSQSVSGLITVAGGKYTTYRVMGEDAIDLAVRSLDKKVPASCTDSIPLIGSDNGYPAVWNRREGIAEESRVALHQRATGAAFGRALVDTHEAGERIAEEPFGAGEQRATGLSERRRRIGYADETSQGVADAARRTLHQESTAVAKSSALIDANETRDRVTKEPAFALNQWPAPLAEYGRLVDADEARERVAEQTAATLDEQPTRLADHRRLVDTHKTRDRIADEPAGALNEGPAPIAELRRLVDTHEARDRIAEESRTAHHERPAGLSEIHVADAAKACEGIARETRLAG